MGWEIITPDHEVKARKEYRCYLCEYPIRKGETHTTWTGKGDGGVERVRAHNVCVAHTEDWDSWEWEEHMDPGDFRKEYGIEPPTGEEPKHA